MTSSQPSISQRPHLQMPSMLGGRAFSTWISGGQNAVCSSSPLMWGGSGPRVARVNEIMAGSSRKRRPHLRPPLAAESSSTFHDNGLLPGVLISPPVASHWGCLEVPLQIQLGPSYSRPCISLSNFALKNYVCAIYSTPTIDSDKRPGHLTTTCDVQLPLPRGWS